MPNNNQPPNGTGGFLDKLASELYDLAKKGLTSDGKLDNLSALSIAEQAKKMILMYKLMVSSSIQEIKLASDISKYLESMYALFTLMVLGFNPLSKEDKEGLNSILNTISAESLRSVESIFSTESIQLSSLLYGMKEPTDYTSKKPRIGKTASTEARRPYRQPYPPTSNDNTNDDDDDDDSKDKDKLRLEESRFASKIESMSNKAFPTIINLSLNGKSGKISIPLAIKVNSYSMKTEEIKFTIESCLSGKHASLLRFIKWKSGELSTLSYIFGTDILKRDKEMFKKLGRNPWIMDLLVRKAKSKGHKFLKNLHDNGYNGKASDLVTDIDIKDLPPIGSLVLTKSDLVSASRLNASNFTKNDNFIKRLMDDLFLMCLGIVDIELENVTFFFRGYVSPFIYSFDELSKGSKDPNQSLYDAMQTLARKV